MLKSGSTGLNSNYFLELQQQPQQHPGSRYTSAYERRSKPAAVSSREDLLSDASVRTKQHLQTSRSLDRYGGGGGDGGGRGRMSRGEDKENAFKARIHVTSPGGRASPSAANRKPYKTTINTANDNIIQYDGGYNRPASSSSRGGQHQQQRQLYQKNQVWKMWAGMR